MVYTYLGVSALNVWFVAESIGALYSLQYMISKCGSTGIFVSNWMVCTSVCWHWMVDVCTREYDNYLLWLHRMVCTGFDGTGRFLSYVAA